MSDIQEFSHRREFAKLRSGTHELRIETGRHKGEELKDRVCVLCARGLVEDEEHLLLDCWLYETYRQRMFSEISNWTGGTYMLNFMRDDREWMVQMIGNCPS